MAEHKTESTIMNDQSPAPTSANFSRRRFLSICPLAVLSLAAPSMPSPKIREGKKIEIPIFNEDQVRQKVIHYSQNGWEPPLAEILGVLISRPRPSEAIKTPGGNATKSFFSVTRVRRILEYAASRSADPRVLAALQTELNRVGWINGQTAWWLFYAAWLKGRIIHSFEECRFECSYTDMIIFHKPKIEELIKWPLRELV